MSANLAALLYLVAGACFIMALRGLSSPATSRTGNTYGMAGMGIAILTTLALARPTGALVWVLIIGGIAIGGTIGAVTARRIPMTAMPQLVAAFHSLVGLAAVFVAAAAFYAPDAFGIATAGDHPWPEPDRDVSRRRHRRRYLHRFDHRLPQARRPHERCSHPAAAAPCHQYRAGRGARGLHLSVLRKPEQHRLLADCSDQLCARLPA